MKKYVNGKYIELTAEEVAEIEKQSKEWEEEQERHKKEYPTESELIDILLGVDAE